MSDNDTTAMDEDRPTHPCFGINIVTLRKRARKDAEIKVRGFKHLAGEAMRIKGTRYSNCLEWPFAFDNTVAGALIKESDPMKPA